MTGTALILNGLFVAALVGFFAACGRLFGPRPVHQGDAELPYETGMLPFEPAGSRMSVLYWRYAVLFVVFDVDLAFLLPWALNRPTFGPESLAAVTLFIALVSLMLAYFWRKGVLECR